MERELQSASSADRRKDAHEKILLGGLVAKAGLRDEDKAVILGLLAEAADALKDKETRERYRQRGKAIFDNDRQAATNAGSAGSPDDRSVHRSTRE
ncbi:conjugal transfer protein TraD [Pararhizobium haloflavum]|uniref:conjugal transfer protein TraD n=1 Tax=Pararhizobium haloflavum TaxID=2037914 RepID=UPI000C1A27F1|nr:conjugal transfer protein TraD [Pararhizobium haloflavum]